MTKRILFIILLLSSFTKMIAQETTPNISSEEAVNVYVAVANVRSSPDQTAQVIDKLYAGKAVNIVEGNATKDTINGQLGHWLKISYRKENSQHEGYIWDDNLSYQQLVKGDIRFLVKIRDAENKTDEDEYYPNVIYWVKAIKGNTVVTENQMKGKRSSSTYSYIQGNNLLSSNETRLTDVEDIITIYSAGEACAVPSYYYYLAWTGSELLPILSGWGVGDESFYKAEEVIFPSDNTPRDILIKLYIDEESEDDSYTKRKTKAHADIYKWNGRKAVLLNKNDSK